MTLPQPPGAPLDPYRAPAELAHTRALMPLVRSAVFPLNVRFRFFSWAPSFTITDANDTVVLHVRQKLFKLREHVEVFADTARVSKVADVRADRVIDWSARYRFAEADGTPIGAAGRRGMRSLWRAHYDVFNPGDEQPDFEIREENPWVKVVDNLIGQIPILGFLTLYFFHPKYIATRVNGEAAMSLCKRPAFLEGRFAIERLGPTTERETMNLILSFLQVVLLERRRG